MSVLALSVFVAAMTGCGSSDKKGVKLDPDNPVSLTVWHYYNGMQQAAFDALTEDDSPLSLFAKNRRKIKSKRIDR